METSNAIVIDDKLPKIHNSDAYNNLNDLFVDARALKEAGFSKAQRGEILGLNSQTLTEGALSYATGVESKLELQGIVQELGEQSMARYHRNEFSTTNYDQGQIQVESLEPAKLKWVASSGNALLSSLSSPKVQKGMKILLTGAGVAGIGYATAGDGIDSASGAVINPEPQDASGNPINYSLSNASMPSLDDVLAASHSIITFFPNPEPLNGPITGFDGLGGKYGLVWENGDVKEYNESHSVINQFGTDFSATALSYVKPGAGILGDIAVANSSSFASFLLGGTEVQTYGVTSPHDITDLDIENGKVAISTTGNMGYWNGTGVDQILSGGVDAILLQGDLIGGEPDRLHTSNSLGNAVTKLNPDGTPIGGSAFATDYFADQGFALTNNYLMTVVNDHVVVYDNPYTAFIPEPATGILLLAGAGLTGIGRKRLKQYSNNADLTHSTTT